MPKIDSSARLAALVRLQVSSHLAAAEGQNSRAMQPLRHDVGEPPTRSEAAVPAEVLLAVRALRGAGDALHLAAFRLFLRHRLIKDLGASTCDDTSFETLLNDVLSTMESDGSLKSSILVAGEQLVALSRQ